MKIKLGTIKNYKDAIKQMEDKDIKISTWAKDILKQVKFSKKKKEVDIEIIKPSDWLTNGYLTIKEIYDKAKEKGLTLLEPEVAVYLRLAYTDQPIYEWLTIAHEPIKDSGGDLRLLCVNRGGDGRWLSSYCDSPDDSPVDRWDREDGFAFSVAQVSSDFEPQPSALDILSLAKRLAEVEARLDKYNLK